VEGLEPAMVGVAALGGGAEGKHGGEYRLSRVLLIGHPISQKSPLGMRNRRHIGHELLNPLLRHHGAKWKINGDFCQATQNAKVLD
jgi:hypothetical protein